MTAPGPWAAYLPRPPGALRFGLTSAVILVLTAPSVFHVRFLGLHPFDDEGYVLILLRAYARGGVLYDDVYSQYGPAFPQLVSVLFRVFGLDFTHTNGRAAATVLTLVTALVCAATTWRLTRSILVAAGVQVQVGRLLMFGAEQFHPGNVVMFVLSLSVLAGSFLGGPRDAVAGAGIGILVGIVLLTKINVGVFALLGVVMALLVTQPRSRVPQMARAGIAVLFAATPLLMLPLAGAPPFRTYLALALSATIPVALVAFCQPNGAPSGLRAVGFVVAGCALTVAASCALELFRGTTPGALVDGLVRLPLGHVGRFSVAPVFGPRTTWWAAGGLLLAVLCVLSGRRGMLGHRWGAALLGLAKVAGGLAIWLASSWAAEWPSMAVSASVLAVASPVLWVALATPGDLAAARVLPHAVLVASAALQVLHAYPVAGTQLAWASFLTVPVAGLALVEGYRLLAGVLASVPRLQPLGHPAFPAVLGIALLVTAASPTWRLHETLARAYEGCVPLALPGTAGIRTLPQQRDLVGLVSRTLAARCATFVTEPGMNSFHLFTGIDPPTGLNMTLWHPYLSDAQQQRVIDRLSHAPPPVCALRRDRTSWDAPLGRYIDREFTPVFRAAQYEVLMRKDNPPAE